MRHNKLSLTLQRQSGAATLILSVVLLMVSSLIIIYAANYGQMLDRMVSNINRQKQAYEAAQAGLEFGINYLNRYTNTIVNNASGGYIPTYSDSNTTNVTFSNSSRFSVNYTNPIAYNYTVIKVTSTGTSDDGTATRTVSQLVKFGSLLFNQPPLSLVTKGSVSLSNNSQITNQYASSTVQSASTFALSGSATTVIDSGTSSTAGNIQSDVTQNMSTLANMSNNELFLSYFGVPQNFISSKATNYYTNSSTTNYGSLLNNTDNAVVWIDQTGGNANLNGVFVAGSSSNPVLLVINGNVALSGLSIIYGFVYINGTLSIGSTASTYIIGGLVTTGNISGTGNLYLYYSPSVLSNTQSQSSTRYYAKIPGSWKDF